MLTRKKFAGIFLPTTSPAAAFTSRFTFKPSLISSVCEARTRWRGLSDDIAGRGRAGRGLGSWVAGGLARERRGNADTACQHHGYALPSRAGRAGSPLHAVGIAHFVLQAGRTTARTE